MRLPQVEHGHRLKERLKLGIIKLVTRNEPEDVVKVTDEDIAALRGRYSDDELFEIITATIVGEATRRVEKVLGLLNLRRDRVA
jgi:hypothetical protein